MKRITLVLMTSLLIVFTNCTNDNATKTQNLNFTPVKIDNPYLKEYANGYTIEVKGSKSNSEVEAYALKENGEASWLWLENNGHDEAVLKDKKTGTWTATKNKITINIQGKSGLITEEYVLANGKFVNTLNNDRYLTISN